MMKPALFNGQSFHVKLLTQRSFLVLIGCVLLNAVQGQSEWKRYDVDKNVSCILPEKPIGEELMGIMTYVAYDYKDEYQVDTYMYQLHDMDGSVLTKSTYPKTKRKCEDFLEGKMNGSLASLGEVVPLFKRFIDLDSVHACVFGVNTVLEGQEYGYVSCSFFREKQLYAFTLITMPGTAEELRAASVPFFESIEIRGGEHYAAEDRDRGSSDDTLADTLGRLIGGTLLIGLVVFFLIYDWKRLKRVAASRQQQQMQQQQTYANQMQQYQASQPVDGVAPPVPPTPPGMPNANPPAEPPPFKPDGDGDGDAPDGNPDNRWKPN